MGEHGSGRRQHRMLPVLSLCVSALCAGCAEPGIDGAPHILAEADAETARPIVVTNERIVLQVHPLRRDGDLTSAQRRRLETFISRFKSEGTGRIRIHAPAHSANDPRLRQTLRSLKQVADAQGIRDSELDGRLYKTRRNTQAIYLTYTRSTAHPPGCRAGFGCASRTNLAALIDRPKDLIEPRPSTPRPAARRDATFARHVQGSATGAVRSTAETVSTTDIGGTP